MPRGLGLFFYGSEGMGKTSLSLQYPKPLKCLSVNQAGYIDLDDVGEVPDGCTNVEIETLPQLRKELSHTTDAATVVVDAALGVQGLIFDFLIETKFGGDSEKFYAYYSGPRQHAPPVASEICQLFENLRSVGKHVIFIGHDAMETVKNPRGVDYTTMDIVMEQGIREIFKQWAQCILYMTLDPNISQVTKTDKSKTPTEAKMEDEDMRVMFTQKSLVHSAKNKLHLPPLISLGRSAPEAYANFVKVLPPNFKEMLMGANKLQSV